MARISAMAPSDSIRTIRQIRLLSPGAAVPASETDYVTVKVGIAASTGVRYIATWSGQKQALAANTPVTLFGASQSAMIVPSGQQVVIDTSVVGDGLLAGMTVVIRVAHSLTDPGQKVKDPSVLATLDALQAMHLGIGVGEYDVTIPLYDTDKDAVFQGRLQLDSTTQVSIQRYSGNWIDVGGDAVSVGSSGILIKTTDGLLTADGGVQSGGAGASTLYNVYVDSNRSGRLCATAPTRYRGTYYLGTDTQTRRWRYVGMVYSNGSTNFTDSVTAREVINYYNVLPLSLFTCPAYSDGNTITSYTHTNTTYGKANAGTGSDVTYLDHGERVLEMRAAGVWTTSGTSITGGIAIGVDGTNLGGAQQSTSANYVNVVGERQATMNQLFPKTQTRGRHTVSLLCVISSGTLTVYADQVRSGSTADPCLTYLAGYCWG